MTLKYNLNKDKQKKVKNLYNLIITNQKKKIFVTTLIAYFIRSVYLELYLDQKLYSKAFSH